MCIRGVVVLTFEKNRKQHFLVDHKCRKNKGFVKKFSLSYPSNRLLTPLMYHGTSGRNLTCGLRNIALGVYNNMVCVCVCIVK